ncbi:TIGR03087 family PEP-CTERM/XrtA system glycosyltransferase [Massilia horti]|uniref:TIGR03087 family PEP-CTERM/XrtA system glycosyltransferase n=1 Tax=Massilia horti TaxID=2562153 RepID=A0A4Y9T4X4_9BURK|nr:TIGR03087 family PEP-CTERM/XrtA system glycosyltransferase [Massilia horti]TFW35386.1 TIGR03087 family PEP-CTERM/XrtA system glycosyltransferase [Massilia horti]
MSAALLPLAAQPELLLLAPSLPAPIDRGERLRWYHMLRYLSQHYRVHLGCFIDERHDRAHISRIKALCYETCLVPIPRTARLASLHWLGRARTAAIARQPDPAIASWTERLLRRHPIQAVLACSARMGAYLAPAAGCLRVVDLVDVESDQRRHAASRLRWPLAALARRDATRLLDHERTLARSADHLLFAANGHADLFARLDPESAHKLHVIGNGVDADYYSPHILHRNPFPAGQRALVFAASMDDRANAAAAIWFARHVLVPLRADDPSLHLWVVGARTAPRLRALAGIAGVSVTGGVSDVRPYLAHAALVVAPLQAGHGFRHKVLEAMAMQKLVIASPQAVDDLSLRPGDELLIADGAHAYLNQVRAALGRIDTAAIGRAARARVLHEHGWAARMAPLAALIESCGARHASA